MSFGENNLCEQPVNDEYYQIFEITEFETDTNCNNNTAAEDALMHLQQGAEDAPFALRYPSIEKEFLSEDEPDDNSNNATIFNTAEDYLYTPATLLQDTAVKYENDCFSENFQPNALYICNICTQNYGSLEELGSHMENCHDMTSTENKSPTSKKNNSNKDKNKLFICNMCGFVSKTGRNLKVHYDKHSEERKHKCNLCNMTYKHYSSLHHHTVKKHLSKKSMPK